ncbi:preprotein translocase subunit YajC [Cellulomonas persica]|uniref:Preprotein translocase subunit YajC n=1 Tax=Cellulomonas persica TaxID=76861 RepID=A0A510UTI7_9CELL|nr:preprotein translocase subunit YajC [Cellulomonas persica]GEK16781.1 hypothetical protein CPE01_05140 [Cellulomonas persica]
MTQLSVALAANSATTTTGGGGGYSMYLILILAVVAFWFMSRRTRKQQRAQQEFRNTLEAGDEVMTASGMIGTVVEIEDDAITLESEPGGGRTRWVRAAIAKKIEPPVVDEDEVDDVDDDADLSDEDLTEDDVIDVPDDLSSLPPTRGDDETDRK